MKVFHAALFLVMAFSLSHAAVAGDDEERLATMRKQITALNLLNGLELDEGQIKTLLGAARDAERARSEARSRLEERRMETAGAYRDVLEKVQDGPSVVPPEIARRVHRNHDEINRIRAETRDAMEEIAARVKDALKPHQLYALNEFKPCIIPPLEKGQYGQADNSEQLGRLLDRAHDMPDEAYWWRRERIVQKAITRMKAKAPPHVEIDEEAIRSYLLGAMDDVRAMPDIEFVKRKDEIADKMKRRLAPRRRPLDVTFKIERFLLQPEIIPVLEKRLADG